MGLLEDVVSGKNSKAIGALAITAGTVGYYFAPAQGPSRLAVQTLAVLAFGYGAYQLLFSSEGLLNFAKAEESLKSESEIGAGAPGGSVVDKILGLAGRATGNEATPGIILSNDRGASSGPYLGTPKNILRVAGKIRSPANGGSATVPLWGDTIAIDGAIENQSTDTRAGILQARLMIEGITEATTVTAGRIELKPGEFKDVSVKVPYRHVGLTAYRTHSVALTFSDFKLDETNFTIERTFF